MSGAVTTAGRVTRRTICLKHSVEFGQTYVPSVPGQSSYWSPPVCRECEADIRRDQLATEILENQTTEIVTEAQRRIAADPKHEENIQERAAAALAEEVAGIVARHCAMRRPEWEKYFTDVRWNEVVAEVESEKRAEFLSR